MLGDDKTPAMSFPRGAPDPAYSTNVIPVKTGIEGRKKPEDIKHIIVI